MVYLRYLQYHKVALIPTLDAHIPSKRYVDDQLAAAISSVFWDLM
jgi:hypothetical protein